MIVLEDLAPGPPPEVVAQRVDAVRARIAATGRDPASVRIVAVTKGFGPAAAAAALAAGVADLGENYAAELLAKAAALGQLGAADAPGLVPRWHFLGAVQRRRVARLAPVVWMWHGVARMAEAQEIARHQPGAHVLVQVNTTGLPGRNGCAPEDTPALVGALRALPLEVVGLMVVGPPGPPSAARRSFHQVADLARQLGLAELSMGMSDDLEVALDEGATIVRLGRALFGDRPPRR